MNKLLIQHLIHDNHHYKLPINPHGVVVVLLKRKDLKENDAYSLSGLPEIILIVKRSLKKELHRQRVSLILPSESLNRGGGAIENFQ